MPLKPGSLLFFDSFLPHGTPTNQDEDGRRRRALQFHYVLGTEKEIAALRVPPERRLERFGTPAAG